MQKFKSGIVIVAAAVTVLSLRAFISAADTGPVYTGSVGNPTKTATDRCTLNVKKADGTRLSIPVDVSVEKTDTSQEKAAKIAAAINNDTDNDVDGNPTTPGTYARATATGHVVAIVGQSNHKLEKASYTDSSCQGGVTLKKQTPPGPSGIGG